MGGRPPLRRVTRGAPTRITVLGAVVPREELHLHARPLRRGLVSVGSEEYGSSKTAVAESQKQIQFEFQKLNLLR